MVTAELIAISLASVAWVGVLLEARTLRFGRKTAELLGGALVKLRLIWRGNVEGF